MELLKFQTGPIINEHPEQLHLKGYCVTLKRSFLNICYNLLYVILLTSVWLHLILTVAPIATPAFLLLIFT